MSQKRRCHKILPVLWKHSVATVNQLRMSLIHQDAIMLLPTIVTGKTGIDVRGSCVRGGGQSGHHWTIPSTPRLMTQPLNCIVKWILQAPLRHMYKLLQQLYCSPFLVLICCSLLLYYCQTAFFFSAPNRCFFWCYSANVLLLCCLSAANYW